MSGAIEPCLTCFRKTDNYLRVADETNADDLERILVTHFWFSEGDCARSVLCTSCWEKIDDFHKFYCEVRRAHHEHRRLGGGGAVEEMQIKVEPLDFIKRECMGEGGKREALSGAEDEDDGWGGFEDEDALEPKIGLAEDEVKGEDTNDDDEVEKVEEVKQQQQQPVPRKRGRPKKIKDPVPEVKVKPKVRPAPPPPKDEDNAEQVIPDSRLPEDEELGIDSGDDSDWDPSRDNDSEDEKPLKQKKKSPAAAKKEKKPRKKYGPRKPREERASNAKTKDEVSKEDEFIRKYCPIYCDKCNFSPETFGELKHHTQTVHNCNPTVVCCEHKFYKRSFLYQHAQYHENPDKFKCQVCLKIFYSGLALKLHMDYTHVTDAEKIYKCEVCQQGFAKSYHLTSHRLKHTSIAEKRFYCEPCDIAFRTNQSYKTHQHSKHGAAAKYVCDICARGFRQRSDLITHQLSHSAEGREQLKVQCEHCLKWMKNKKSIWTHRRICQSAGPVACDICGKMAPNPEQLKSHKKFMHQDQRVHQCQYCEKAFKRPIDLKEHETIHTGEVLYSCNFCPKTFNSNSNLYSHRRKMHPIEYADWKVTLQMRKQPAGRPQRAETATASGSSAPAAMPPALMPTSELPPSVSYLPPLPPPHLQSIMVPLPVTQQQSSSSAAAAAAVAMAAAQHMLSPASGGGGDNYA